MIKKAICGILLIAVAFSICACGEKPGEVIVGDASPMPDCLLPITAPETSAEPAPTPAPTVEPSPVPLIPSLPPVWDESLNAVLDEVADNVRPGTAGTGLRAVACAAHLLDWAQGSSLTDDEVYSAVQCWMETLDNDRLNNLLNSILDVYDSCYDLRTDNADVLLEEAGVEHSAWPWSDATFRRVEMVCYACGTR